MQAENAESHVWVLQMPLLYSFCAPLLPVNKLIVVILMI